VTLKLNTVLAVVKVHLHTKYHQALCSSSWVIVLTEENQKSDQKTNLAIVLKAILSLLPYTITSKSRHTHKNRQRQTMTNRCPKRN